MFETEKKNILFFMCEKKTFFFSGVAQKEKKIENFCPQCFKVWRKNYNLWNRVKIFFSHLGKRQKISSFQSLFLEKTFWGKKKIFMHETEFFFCSLCLDFFHFVSQLKKKSGFFLTGVKLSQKRIMKRLFFSEYKKDVLLGTFSFF